ncbi:MAG: glycosyltransferase family A protein [Nitrospirota bacterium]
MGKVNLSICIPTYNFGKYIEETLQSILCQITEAVEVVIVDGASTDETQEIVRKLQQTFPQIHYNRCDQRGGIDKDMAKTVEIAEGKYCWLFSADDLMKPNAISKILHEIQSECDLYLCGLTLCTLAMKPFSNHPVCALNEEKIFDLSNAEERLRYFQIAQTTTAFFSFCGSLIFKKSRWDAVAPDPSFYGGCFAHAARLLCMIPHGLRVKYLPDSLLYKRGDNDSFLSHGMANRLRIVIDGYHQIANTFFGAKSEEAFHIRRALRNEVQFYKFLNPKLECQEKGLKKDLELLNSLVQKHYADPSLLNRTYKLLYQFTPLVLLKMARPILKIAKPIARSIIRAFHKTGDVLVKG